MIFNDVKGFIVNSIVHAVVAEIEMVVVVALGLNHDGIPVHQEKHKDNYGTGYPLCLFNPPLIFSQLRKPSAYSVANYGHINLTLKHHVYCF